MKRTWREETAQVKQSKNQLFGTRRRKRAENWMTCAIGEQHDALPEVVQYRGLGTPRPYPADERLRILGHDFYEAVRANDLDEVEQLLDLIEDRVLELKRGAE